MRVLKNRLHTRWYILLVLFLATVFVWYVVVEETPSNILTVSFLDVGQGDAILISAPNRNQVLIDGGSRGEVVLRKLRRVMPFYDRFIDVVIATHPDADHIGGLVEVLDRFNVGIVTEPGVTSDTSVYQAFESVIYENDITYATARRGMKIILDNNVVLSILFPDRDVTSLETNTASIVSKLVYGDACFLFTADSPKSIERYLLELDGPDLSCTVLKVGHHGSKTSTDEIFLGRVNPDYGIISAGKNNRYGHPHREVLDTLARFGVEILRTDEKGTITMETDGRTIRLMR